jgi:signal transduction histidine kinase
MLRSEFVAEDVMVDTDCAAGAATVKGNRTQLQQVLVNLIMNGCEAMGDVKKKDRRLRISTELKADELVVSVEDSGPGIDAERLEHIFEPLATWKPGGTGMGLAISGSIIQAHGGRTFAENQPEGGARVGFAVPAAGEKS